MNIKNKLFLFNTLLVVIPVCIFLTFITVFFNRNLKVANDRLLGNSQVALDESKSSVSDEDLFNELNLQNSSVKNSIENLCDKQKSYLNVLEKNLALMSANTLTRAIDDNKQAKDEVEEYFSFYFDSIKELSQDRNVIKGVKTFSNNIRKLKIVQDFSSEMLQRMRDTLLSYYIKNFSSEYRKINNGEFPMVTKLISHLEDKAVVFQYYFSGTKSLPPADLKSGYFDVHDNIHPMMQAYLKNIGCSDIYLVDSKTAEILYSVKKKIDFATSLKKGAFSNSAIAKAFNLCNEKKETVFIDYESYTPSFEKPYFFMATPIYDNRNKVAVAIFQISLEDFVTFIAEKKSSEGAVGLSILNKKGELIASSKNNSIEIPVTEKEGLILRKNSKGELLITEKGALEIQGLKWFIVTQADFSKIFEDEIRKFNPYFKNLIATSVFSDIILLNSQSECLFSFSNKYSVGSIVNPQTLSASEGNFFISSLFKTDNDMEMTVALEGSFGRFEEIFEDEINYFAGKKLLVADDSGNIVFESKNFGTKNHESLFALINSFSGKSENRKLAEENNNKSLVSSLTCDVFGKQWTLISSADLSKGNTAKVSNKETVIGKERKIVFSRSTVLVLGVLVFACFVVLLFVNTFMKKFIVDPINKLNVALDQIDAKNDFTAKIDINEGEEIDALASKINNLTDRMGAIVRNTQEFTLDVDKNFKSMNDSSKSIFESSYNLTSAVCESGAAVNEMGDNVKNVVSEIENQRNSVNETSAAVEEISHNVHSILGTLKNQFEAVEESAHSIEDLVVNIRDIASNCSEVNDITNGLDEKANHGNEALSETVAGMKDIASSSEQVKKNN